MLITIDTTKDSAEAVQAAAEFAKVVLTFTRVQAAPVPQQPAPVSQPAAIPPAPDFAPSDNMPPDNFELGKSATDAQAAAVFGANAPLVPAVPVPPVTVPVPPVAHAVAPAGVIERDSAGIPYDARIHNKSRTKKQNGEWKLAKGMDPNVVAAVLAELKTGVPQAGAPAPIPAPPAFPPVAHAVAVPLPPSGPTATVQVPPAPNVPPAPAVVAQPVPVAVGTVPVPPNNPVGPVTFRSVMAKVTAGTAAGKLTKTDVDAALGQVGLKPDELAPLCLPANVHLLTAFNGLIDAKVA